MLAAGPAIIIFDAPANTHLLLRLLARQKKHTLFHIIYHQKAAIFLILGAIRR